MGVPYRSGAATGLHKAEAAHARGGSEQNATNTITGFVELMAPATTQNCECVIEVEGPRGHIRIEWKSSVAPDLTGLSRMLWEPGA